MNKRSFEQAMAIEKKNKERMLKLKWNLFLDKD